MARRMLTIDEIRLGLSNSCVVDIGLVDDTTLIKDKIAAGKNGLYLFRTSSRAYLCLITFSINNDLVSGMCYSGTSAQVLTYNFMTSYATTKFLDIYYGTVMNRTPLVTSNVTSINTNLGGTPIYGTENDTLHIRGTFTPTGTIAAGSKLFSTGQPLSARMTHGSAINTGTAGSETFVGISIQTNGDVYCLGALNSGVIYNIAVTATL